MTVLRCFAGASLAALGLMLAACGGGGVNSTPTPTPGGGGTPTPTPSQANSTLPSFVPALAVASSSQTAPPSGGGVVIVTPTPTPTPSANDDLLSPLASEQFMALGVVGTAEISKLNGAGSNGSWTEALSITYDSAAQTYTVNGIAFGPADKVNGASNGQFTTFQKIAGNTGQSLVLTAPGTSGRFTYRYVGAGFLQQVQEYSDLLRGYLKAFVYGVETPESSVPRSGSGSYNVDMLAVIAADGALHDLHGSGTLGVNFTSGAITTSGAAKQYAQTGVFETSRSWTGDAQLRSDYNFFEGSLSVSGMDRAEWLGKFYGPSAQEVGSVFQSTNGGPTLAGTLIGRTAGQ